MTTFEQIVFGVAFVVVLGGVVGIAPPMAVIALLVFAIIYLFSGWFLLLPGKGKTERWLPFLVSYLISQTLVVEIFGINQWPLKETFSYVTLIILLTTIIIFFLYKKTISGKYPFNEYMVRMIVCFMFSGAPLWL